MFKKLFGKKEVRDVQEDTVKVFISPKKTGEALEIEELGQLVRNNTGDEKTEIPYFNREQVKVFENILERRVQAYLNDPENEGDIETEEDLISLKQDFGQRLLNEILPELTNAEREYFTTEYSAKLQGVKTYRTVTEDNNYESIHGIDMKAFAEGSFRMASGEDGDEVIKSYGVSNEQWGEITLAWTERMKHDNNLVILYSQYMKPTEVEINNFSEAGQRLVQDRRYFQDVFAYYQAAYSLGLDGEALTKEKFGHASFDLQQANQFWAKEDAASYDHTVFFDPYFKERQKAYERELTKMESLADNPLSGVKFDLQDFGQQAKLLDLEACITKLGTNHPALKFLNSKDEEEIEELGKVLFHQGDVNIVGDFSSYPDDIFAGDEELSEEEIGLIIILGNLTVSKDAHINTHFYVEGNVIAKSVDILNDDEEQNIIITGDCTVTTGFFISNSVINLGITGELKTPCVLTAVREGQLKINKVNANAIGINGYVDDEELGTDKLIKSLGLAQTISADNLAKVSNFDEDAMMTEDIIKDIIDGDIKFN
ncbi:hypothetical protein [Listeria farberi]|uniref:Uncharacterized protein n=1 Tax=Listeria farberi TaxID=2713500 RepID=A0A7X0ZIK3_9LIST|nr:hypothetical protein [Listeria farberi]MBC1375939.1 hypothetical protein [Listeria farberi]MBC1382042.1 hypothetical protein [Listeria farberi]MBC2268212.1 hypothetical protein [Listeria farberi]MBC2287979.1 hypothetical protein [Listeria farberi]